MAAERKHILVVEDNVALSKVIGFNLELAGFEVTSSPNGRVAWELAQSHTYDLILTDEQMPVMTGIEFCRKLRTRREYAEVPVILLTAKGLELDVEGLSQELGIVSFFLKPFSPNELVSRVAELLMPARS